MLCGVHSRGKDRVQLTKPTKGERNAFNAARDERIFAQANARAKENRKAGRKGTVKIYHMRMMKRIEYPLGYMPVFPNRRHGDRTDGMGCPSLSPFNIGPIPLHGSPSECVSLEAFQQWSKCFKHEVEMDGTIPRFYVERDRVFSTPGEAQRHKASMEDFAFFVHVGADGMERRYSYLESRVFYCTYYDIMARKLDEYRKLERMLTRGYDLLICGYDAKHSEEELEDLDRCYSAMIIPFGHELVLYTMLTGKDKPWEKSPLYGEVCTRGL